VKNFKRVAELLPNDHFIVLVKDIEYILPTKKIFTKHREFRTLSGLIFLKEVRYAGQYRQKIRVVFSPQPDCGKKNGSQSSMG
jgi:hypothetical protein